MMDPGMLIPAGMIATGLGGMAHLAWSGRRRPQSPVTATRSHVRRVPVPVVRGVGPSREAATGVPSGSNGSTDVPSLAMDAVWSMAGGTELEARLEVARRRLALHRTFGDAQLRHRGRDPQIVSAVESYLAHPSHGVDA